MASNNFATIAAATAAGYVPERFTRGGLNVTRLSRPMSGFPGAGGRLEQTEGEASTSAQADTNALGAINGWRNLRYGFDSANQSLSPIPDQRPDGIVDKQPNHQKLTKDQH
jgi:hypothetical protein